MTNVTQLLESLRESIKREDKQAILHLYDEFGTVDWENIPKNLGEEYDELVSLANDILYKD